MPRDARSPSAGTSARRAQGGRDLEMEIDMREAQPTDAETLIALDEIARVDPGRAGVTRETVASGGCLVAGQAGRAVGYGVLEHACFGHRFVSMLSIDAGHRRRGAGLALLRTVGGLTPAVTPEGLVRLIAGLRGLA